MNSFTFFILRVLRKIVNNKYHIPLGYKGYLDYCGQEANDYLLSYLEKASENGKMICKFGTIELDK